MLKSTVVIADRLLLDDADIGDNVKVTLPTLSWKTATLTGAGIGGDLTVPLVGLAEAMTVQIDLRSVSDENAAKLMAPGVHRLEVRSNRSVLDAAGQQAVANTRVYLNVMFNSLTAGGIQRGNAMDSSVTLSASRYRWVEDGRELFLFDQLNEVVKINGADHSSALRL